jgi:hypothetical protein
MEMLKRASIVEPSTPIAEYVASCSSFSLCITSFSSRPQCPSGGESRAPAPEELLRPAPLRPAPKGKTYYYAVTVGRKPGVYENWYVHVCLGSLRNPAYMVLSRTDAKAQTDGVAPSPNKFTKWDAAVNKYKEEFKKGMCQVKMHK